MRHRYREPEYLPTPYEIERACEEIRNGWSDRERQSRELFTVRFPKPPISDTTHTEPEVAKLSC